MKGSALGQIARAEALRRILGTRDLGLSAAKKSVTARRADTLRRAVDSRAHDVLRLAGNENKMAEQQWAQICKGWVELECCALWRDRAHAVRYPGILAARPALAVARAADGKEGEILPKAIGKPRPKLNCYRLEDAQSTIVKLHQ